MLKEMLNRIEKSRYECIAGDLKNNIEWQKLKRLADDQNDYAVCSLGRSHECILNVNEGYCAAEKCMFRVVQAI